MSTLHALSRELRVPYRTLARWVAQGSVVPEGGRRPAGPGRAFALSEKNEREVRNLVALRRAGLSGQKLRQLANGLQAAGYNPFSRGAFVVVDKRQGRVVRISEDEAHAREVMGPHEGQYAFVQLLGGEEKKTPPETAGTTRYPTLPGREVRRQYFDIENLVTAGLSFFAAEMLVNTLAATGRYRNDWDKPFYIVVKNRSLLSFTESNVRWVRRYAARHKATVVRLGRRVGVERYGSAARPRKEVAAPK